MRESLIGQMVDIYYIQIYDRPASYYNSDIDKAVHNIYRGIDH